MEKEIGFLEEELKAITALLENKDQSRESVVESGQRYVELQQILDERLKEWDTILSNSSMGEETR